MRTSSTFAHCSSAGASSSGLTSDDSTGSRSRTLSSVGLSPMVSDSYVEETMSQLVFSLPAQTLVPNPSPKMQTVAGSPWMVTLEPTSAYSSSDSAGVVSAVTGSELAVVVGSAGGVGEGASADSDVEAVVVVAWVVVVEVDSSASPDEQADKAKAPREATASKVRARVVVILLRVILDRRRC